jgi:hypothetical protein
VRDRRPLFVEAYEQAAREADADQMPALARLARESAERLRQSMRDEPCRSF